MHESPDTRPVLDLRLEPVIATRIPRSSRAKTASRGYRLVLGDGTPIAQDDPLLESFGARVVQLSEESTDSTVLQEDAFRPGQVVQVELAPRPGDRSHVLVLDGDGVRCVGALPRSHAPRVAAAIDHGLELVCRVLSEQRLLDTGERVGLRVLVAPAAFCRVRPPATEPPDVERVASRPRLVLVAGADGTLRWWDPSARSAPLDVEDLPVSSDLASELRGLQHDWESLDDDDARFFAHWERAELERRARALWRRARDELAAHYAVGWKPAGEADAIYTDVADPDDDIPF